MGIKIHIRSKSQMTQSQMTLCALCDTKIKPKPKGASIHVKAPTGSDFRFKGASLCKKCFTDFVSGDLKHSEAVFIVNAMRRLRLK